MAMITLYTQVFYEAGAAASDTQNGWRRVRLPVAHRARDTVELLLPITPDVW